MITHMDTINQVENEIVGLDEEIQSAGSLYTRDTWSSVMRDIGDCVSFYGYCLATQQFVKRIQFIFNTNDLPKIQEELQKLIAERRDFLLFAHQNEPEYAP